MKDRFTLKTESTLLIVGMVMLSFMTAYEFLRNFLWWDLSVWQSLIMTIIVTSVLALIVSGIICRIHNAVIITLVDERTRRLNTQNTRHSEKEKIVQPPVDVHDYLSICSHCKSIRDSDGNWYAVESYVTTCTDTELSHGICPSCRRLFYQDLLPPD